MDNRLTFSTLICPAWPLEKIIDQAARCGAQGIDFRGVETVVDHSTLPAFTTDAATTLAALKRHGLETPCMCSSIALMTPDPAKWNAMLEEFTRYLAISDTFGSAFIRIFPGRTPSEMPRDEAASMARRHARQLAKLASSHRVKPILETHDDWGASTEVIKLVADCDPDEFGVLWDVRHTWAAKETPEQALATLGTRLKHVHVKDSVMKDGREIPALLGEGVVSVGDSLRALKAANFAGWICLETEKRWHPDVAPLPEESLPQYVKFVRAI
jgi:sugar phosphate isomerase/epimerase